MSKGSMTTPEMREQIAEIVRRIRAEMLHDREGRGGSDTDLEWADRIAALYRTDRERRQGERREAQHGRRAYEDAELVLGWTDDLDRRQLRDRRTTDRRKGER